MKANRDSWYWKLKLDDMLFAAANLAASVRDIGRSKQHIARNAELIGRHKGKRAFILATGPSILQEDLAPLADEITFATNFFLFHSQLAHIDPTYWVIYDKKLIDGGWPPELFERGAMPGGMLDRIREGAPGTTFLLNEAFRNDPRMTDALGASAHYWLRANRMLHLGYKGKSSLTGALAQGGNVVHLAIAAAASMGIKDIYLLGVDGNGLVLDLVGQPSHFYGGAPENADYDHEKIERDLIMSGYGFRFWRAIEAYYRQRGVRIVNLSKGNLLTALERADLADIVS